jgi:hypothetical protein
VNQDRPAPTPSLRDLVAERRDGNGTAAEAIELVEGHGATVTVALLVCTHRRFERCARTLMRDLTASELLDDHQLGELADALLWEDRVAFAVPARWLAGPLPAGRRYRASGRPLVGPGTAAARQTLPYRCRPPAAARRWAATWVLRHDATQVEEVLAWAGRFDAGAGGAIVSGVLDAATSLSGGQLEPAVRRALAWPTSSVRRRALDVLADTGRADEARDLAAGDSAADVRRWRPASDRAAPAAPTLFELGE